VKEEFVGDRGKGREGKRNPAHHGRRKIMKTPLPHSGGILWRRVLKGMAAMSLACGLLVTVAIAADPAGPDPSRNAGAPDARIREVTVSKSPYNTTIQASIDGEIENYNSFKLDDPFRIVVDVWGVAQGTAASEIPVGTPQVKMVKISTVDRKLRMVVETPDDRPMPFIVSARRESSPCPSGAERKGRSQHGPVRGRKGPGERSRRRRNRPGRPARTRRMS